MTKWILVPVVTEKEASDDFIDAINDAGKVILLFVVDEESRDLQAGIAGGKIKKAEEVIDHIKQKLPNLVQVKDYIEWGDWMQKIENISALEKVDEVVMVRDERSEKLRNSLKGKVKVRTVKVSTDQP